MIKFAICDDESYMLSDLSTQLTNFMNTTKQECEITCFSDGDSLLQSDLHFDLIFLDIQMGEPNGMKTAQLLRERDYEGLLIFVTVLKENVFDAFHVEAFDYLLKPVDDNRFASTMQRVLNLLKKQNRKVITIKKGNTHQIVHLSDVIYFEVLGRKIYIHMKHNEKIDYYCKLEDLEQKVDSRFFKCHRSYLVNLDCVRGLNNGEISLIEGAVIPVSRLREQEFAQALLSHMKERRR